jgi:uncharacterized protein YkwD
MSTASRVRRSLEPAVSHRWLAVSAIFLLLWALLASPARAETSNSADQLVDLANSSRAAAGLPAYSVAADLSHVARQQAVRMANEHHIFHNPNLRTDVADWYMVGENVGVGQSPEQIHAAFMASPTHRADILSSDFTEIGVGFAVGDDRRLYVSEVFRLREAHVVTVAQPIAALPEPAPAAPAFAPAPAPAPAPTTTTAEVIPTTSTTRTMPTPTAVDMRAATAVAAHRAIAPASPARPRPQWGALAASLLAAALAFGVLSAHVAHATSSDDAQRR